jgi:hypothetical protein
VPQTVPRRAGIDRYIRLRGGDRWVRCCRVSHDHLRARPTG